MAKKTNVVVYVSGGNVQGAIADSDDVEVFIVDYDNGQDATEEDPQGCALLDGDWASISREAMANMPHSVGEVLEAFEQCGIEDAKAKEG